MKHLYRICTAFLLLFSIFFIGSVSVFLLKKPDLPKENEITQIIVDEFVINKKIIDNQTSYLCKTNKDIDENKAISVAFLLFEKENNAINLTIEDNSKYYQLIVSMFEQASIVVAEK